MVEEQTNKERENRILDAASDLLLHYGFDKTTVSEIAKEAGVSKGAIYLHFSSKETVFDALIQRDMQRSVTDVMQALSDDRENWSFINMYQTSLKITTNYPVLMALVRTDARFGSYFKKTSLDIHRMKQQSRYPMLKAMQDVGALRDDLDMRNVDAILSLIGYGFINADEALPGDSDPPIDGIVEAIGGMMEAWLVPQDGGNRDGGHQIIMGVLEQFQRQMNLKKSGEIESKDQ